MKKLPSIDDVVNSGLCSGCGVCAYLQPNDIRMTDISDQGLRPISKSGTPIPNGDAVRACPGIELRHDFDAQDAEIIQDLEKGWGPVRNLWEGYAQDPELRYAASSGGAASALALHALTTERFAGVLHTAANKELPYTNETVFSTSRQELLERTGSRYAPASPADGLKQIEDADGPCVFIGKPCDVAAVQRARKMRPRLDKNLGLTIAFFCAGTPSTQGTLKMLERMGIADASTLMQLRYRGNGWPGAATAIASSDDGQPITHQISYEQSWGQVLTKFVQWRCRLCADHTGEFADISVGDPWYRPVEPGESGSSLVLARTRLGIEFTTAAIASGQLILRQGAPELLERSQPNLLRTRGAVWGRIAALRLIGAKVPVYHRLRTLDFWLSELTLTEKLKSILGTVRRCLQRGFHPLQWQHHRAQITGDEATRSINK